MLVRTALTALPEPRLRGWGIAGVVAASLIAAVVAVQVWFTLRWERQIRHTGLLQAPTWIIVLSDSEPPDDRSVIETLPLRDRKGLARSFLRDFGIGHPLAERRAHGAMDQLRREDKGFLFDVAGRRAGATPVDPALHYVVLPARGPGLDRRRPAVACRSVRDRLPTGLPWIMRRGGGARAATSTIGARAWTTRGGPSGHASRAAAGCHGVRRHPVHALARQRRRLQRSDVARPHERPAWLVVNVSDSHFGRHQLERMYLDGLPLAAATVSHNSSNFRNLDILFDLVAALGQA